MVPSVFFVVATLFVSVQSTCNLQTNTKFAHPGLLHSAEDLLRMKTKVAAGLEPWKSGFEILTNNSHSHTTWKANPSKIVYRGRNHEHAQNYGILYNDVAAAYALALRWHITGNDSYADTAILILNGWGKNLTDIQGPSDKYLASGLYGYQLANAAELLRGYSKWAKADFDQFVDMMLKVFYVKNNEFLTLHYGARIDHYWANWDLSNMASMISIGVLADRVDIFNEAVDYFMHGKGNGGINQAIWKIYPDGLGQVQESGRDQGHATLAMTLMGIFCQMAFTQKCDLFAYDNNRVLAGAEYVAKFNLGYDVPYTSYNNSDNVSQTVISQGGRGIGRATWELFYNHYVVRKGLKAPFIEQFAVKMRPEGGGGNYGGNSGGFDQLGYGTLAYSLPSTPEPSPTSADQTPSTLERRSSSSQPPEVKRPKKCMSSE